MTASLEQALRRVESLSPEEQDAIASQIMEDLDEEKAWTGRFRNLPQSLRTMARQAMEEHKNGATESLDDFIK